MKTVTREFKKGAKKVSQPADYPHRHAGDRHFKRDATITFQQFETAAEARAVHPHYAASMSDEAVLADANMRLAMAAHYEEYQRNGAL